MTDDTCKELLARITQAEHGIDSIGDAIYAYRERYASGSASDWMPDAINRALEKASEALGALTRVCDEINSTARHLRVAPETSEANAPLGEGTSENHPSHASDVQQMDGRTA